jgi:hypothetical protein
MEGSTIKKKKKTGKKGENKGDGGRRERTQDIFQHTAGQEHAEIVEHRVKVDPKDHWVQPGRAPKNAALFGNPRGHLKKYVDVQQ